MAKQIKDGPELTKYQQALNTIETSANLLASRAKQYAPNVDHRNEIMQIGAAIATLKAMDEDAPKDDGKQDVSAAVQAVQAAQAAQAK